MALKKLRELLKKLRDKANNNSKALKFIKYWKEYFDKTTVHGLRFIFKSSVNKYQRQDNVKSFDRKTLYL